MTGHHVDEQIQIPVRESSQVADVRRKVTGLAGRAGFDETQAGTCAVIASEMGTNLVKHAKEGEIFLRTLANGAEHGIEILSIDRGPGMANVGHALQDGHSTAGSSGTGLGAIGRMASEFDMHSVPGRGTTFIARIWQRTAPGLVKDPKPLTGVICLAKPGESISGDAWLSDSSGRRTLCAVVDGLGHGPLAAKAAALAIDSLRDHADSPLIEQIQFAHAALQPTRGAAMGLAEIVHNRNQVNFVGIGNIMAAVLQDSKVRHMVSQNGTLGHQLQRVTEFHYPWSDSAMLIMCSDGINTHWDVAPYVGLRNHDPSLIAATLYRDFTRGRDDTTVLVMKTGSADMVPAGGNRTG